jgi:hypothetical protein
VNLVESDPVPARVHIGTILDWRPDSPTLLGNSDFFSWINLVIYKLLGIK